MRRMLVVAMVCLAFLLQSVEIVFATDANSANYSNFIPLSRQAQT